MYKVWSITDIKIIINEISEKWNYPCDIKIEISKRAKKRMGAFFYKKYNRKIQNPICRRKLDQITFFFGVVAIKSLR